MFYIIILYYALPFTLNHPPQNLERSTLLVRLLSLGQCATIRLDGALKLVPNAKLVRVRIRRPGLTEPADRTGADFEELLSHTKTDQSTDHYTMGEVGERTNILCKFLLI